MNMDTLTLIFFAVNLTYIVTNVYDFPATFARSIRWLPFVLCALLAVNFLLNDALVKMVRDLIFTVIGTWFAIYTLNPHRKIKKLTCDVEHATLQIVDLMGRVIVSRRGDGIQRVSTSGMVPGIYVLRLIDGNVVRTQKIVIE